jgi:hypothetical protein
VYAGDGTNYIHAAPNSAAKAGLPTNPLEGANGPDDIYAANGTYNYVWCGNDVDHVVADKIDFVEPNCENVELR